MLIEKTETRYFFYFTDGEKNRRRTRAINQIKTTFVLLNFRYVGISLTRVV